jgi:hypothetical protein
MAMLRNDGVLLSRSTARAQQPQLPPRLTRGTTTIEYKIVTTPPYGVEVPASTTPDTGTYPAPAVAPVPE